MNLLPCPFCGCRDIFHIEDDVSSLVPPIYYTQCRECRTSKSGKSIDEADVKWNTRVESNQDKETV